MNPQKEKEELAYEFTPDNVTSENFSNLSYSELFREIHFMPVKTMFLSGFYLRVDEIIISEGSPKVLRRFFKVSSKVFRRFS